ncbi:hypothetical protein GBF38_000212 [Nibea albiflora]|nr:hypothetical protein GBF38_000212 [Nibea albiflora]
MIARDPEKVTGHLRLIKFVSPPPQFFRDGRTLSVDLEAVTSRSNKLRLTENILNSGVYHSVQSSCIGWKDQRLREIRRRAKHAEERQTEERDKELEKTLIARDPEKVTGHLRLIKFVSPPPQFFRDGRTLSVDLEAVTLEVQQTQINRKHPKFRPTNPLHPSLLHPNHNMPMVEYPGPTGPIESKGDGPDMMEAGKQLPSLESGGRRFGEELVSFCIA